MKIHEQTTKRGPYTATHPNWQGHGRHRFDPGPNLPGNHKKKTSKRRAAKAGRKAARK